MYRRSSDGRWVGAARVEGKREFVYGTSRKAVVARLREVRTAAPRATTTAASELTVGRHLAQWLDDKRQTVRPSTWVTYEIHVRLHLATLAHMSLASLTPSDVRGMIQNRLADGCAPGTVGHTVTVLRMAIQQAVGDGLLSRNVALFADPPSVPRGEIAILAVDEAERLFGLPTTLAPLWALLVGTGLRLGEALGLRWADIDLAGGTLTIRVALRSVPRAFRPEAPKGARTGQRLQLVEPKTASSRRTLALPGFVVRALLGHREQQLGLPRNILGLVFTTPRGTPLDQRNVSRTFAGDCAMAGLPHMRLHDLRHTAATMMLAQGASLDDVKRVLGHTSIALTSDTYGHLVAGRSREVADGLDRLFG